jgi:CRP/FNR family transcriptional regulator
MSHTNIEDRLYNVLKNVAKQHGQKDTRGRLIQFPLIHEDLSFLTGTHRVSITRAIKTLKNKGKILLEDKKLILTKIQIS